MNDGTIIQIDLDFYYDGPGVPATEPPPHPVTISCMSADQGGGGSAVFRVTGPRGLVREYMLYAYTPDVDDVNDLLNDYAVAV